MSIRVRGALRWLMVVLFGTVCAVEGASAGPTVSVNPGFTSVATGNSFDITVNVAGVSDLYAFQFDLAFDPTVLVATGIDEGSFLPSAGFTFYLPGTIDNSLGVIAFTADTLLGPGTGASGDGDLAVIHFKAIGPGGSGLSLSGISLLDSTLTDIATDVAAGRVDVTGRLPEPATGFLLLSGLALAAPRRRWQSERVGR